MDFLLNVTILTISMKTRILLLINHLAYGGAARGVALWTKILADTDYDTTVLTYYSQPNEYPLDSRVKRINLFTSHQNYMELTEKISVCQKLLNQYLSHNTYDILIPLLFECNIIASTCPNRPNRTTQTILNSPWHNEQGFKLCMRDWAIQKQGSVILQNAEQAEYFNTPLFKHVKKYIVHNPLNPDIIHLKKDNYLPIKNIVTVGRLVPQKNHALMIEIIRILRDEFHENYHLDIFGAGELQEQLQQQINTNHLNNLIKLKGHSNDIFHELINYDLFLMTSLHEGTPNALLEAMGLGLPSLAVKCRTGITELIQNNKNGYFVDSYDPHIIAKKIHEINQPKQLEAIGKQARQDMFNRYSTDKVQTELVTAIEDLLHSKPKKHRAIIPPYLPVTQEEYQNYFEYTLYAIKNASYSFGKQIFNHTRHVLKNINLSISISHEVLQVYYEKLHKNDFKHMYQYLKKNSPDKNS